MKSIKKFALIFSLEILAPVIGMSLAFAIWL